MKQKSIPKKGLRWNPPGKRKQGRHKRTLRKTFEGDFKLIELTWGTSKREEEVEAFEDNCVLISDQLNKMAEILQSNIQRNLTAGIDVTSKM